MFRFIIFLLLAMIFFSGCSTKNKPKKSPCQVRNFSDHVLEVYLVKDKKTGQEKNFFGNDIVDCLNL